MTCDFLIQLVFCEKKLCGLLVLIEQETSAPPPKKNPGSAPDTRCISGYLFYFERPLKRPKQSTHICSPKVTIRKSRKEPCVSPAFPLRPMMPRASPFFSHLIISVYVLFHYLFLSNFLKKMKYIFLYIYLSCIASEMLIFHHNCLFSLYQHLLTPFI